MPCQKQRRCLAKTQRHLQQKESKRKRCETSRVQEGLLERTIEQVGPVCEEGVPNALHGLRLGGVRCSGSSFGRRSCHGCFLKRRWSRAQTPTVNAMEGSLSCRKRRASTAAHQIALPLFESRESLICALRRSTTCTKQKLGTQR